VNAVRVAIGIALGLESGDPPDRFLVALATLGLMSAFAEERPLFCVVDDLQWLDDASARVLGFVASRLLAEPVALLFAVREPSGEHQLVGLPELQVRGLDDGDAFVTGSSRRPAATRSQYSSCHAG
jgi:hypothetical protein